jgi:hypothetical protein
VLLRGERYLECSAMGRAIHRLLSAIAGISMLAASGSGHAAPAPQRPYWSGVWALSDASFWKANLDAYANDIGLTPKYQAIRAQARETRHQANQTTCLPAGATAAHQHGMLFEVFITPVRVLIAFEDGELRRIYTDGRKHRSLEDLHNSYMGDSIGRWEGSTLVVSTIGFPMGELWQNYGVRATIDTRLDERFFVNAAGELQIDSVLTDPEIFARPYRYTRLNNKQQLELHEAACLQNNRDDGTNIDLTPPPE